MARKYRNLEVVNFFKRNEENTQKRELQGGNITRELSLGSTANRKLEELNSKALNELLDRFKCLVHQQPGDLQRNKDILQRIMQESKEVEVFVWLIVREYSILSLEYPDKTKHSLLKALDKCFNIVIDREFIVRLVKQLKHDDAVSRVERFTRNHKVELEEKMSHNHLSRKLLTVNLSNQPEIAANSGARPSSWINDLFGWVKSSIGGLLSSKPVGISNTKDSISQIDAPMDVNGTIMLLDLLIRRVTGQKYISTVDQHISPLEAQGYALNITKRFEKVLNETAIKPGISVTNLNFDPVAVQSAIVGQIISEKFSKIPKTLYSFAKEACPEFQQTDKFLVHLRS